MAADLAVAAALISATRDVPAAATLALGLLGMLVGRERRTLHDVAAGTVVVYDWGARQAEQPVTIAEDDAGALARMRGANLALTLLGRLTALLLELPELLLAGALDGQHGRTIAAAPAHRTTNASHAPSGDSRGSVRSRPARAMSTLISITMRVGATRGPSGADAKPVWSGSQNARMLVKLETRRGGTMKKLIKLIVVLAIIETESSFNPRAVSPVPAFGLMQLGPRTAGVDAYQRVYGEKKILSDDLRKTLGEVIKEFKERFLADRES